MENKNFEAQSKAMSELWNDENRRKEVIVGGMAPAELGLL